MTIHYISFEPWADDYIGDVLYAPRDILADSASESKSLLSFWLGAPQEPWTNFLPYLPNNYRVRTYWPTNPFSIEICYLDSLKCVDYRTWKEYKEELPSWSERSLSFWLGQEAEELVV